MLLELTVAEHHFNAVMEVLRAGLTVVEVAEPARAQPLSVRWIDWAWRPG